MTLGAAIARASHARQNASRAVKKKRARPLERAPGTDHCVGDRTTTTPCLALPWTGSWFQSVSRTGAGNSVLAAASGAVKHLLQHGRYRTTCLSYFSPWSR